MSVEGFSAENKSKNDFQYPKPRIKRDHILKIGSEVVSGENNMGRTHSSDSGIARIGFDRLGKSKGSFKIPEIKPVNSNDVPVIEVGATRILGEPKHGVPNLGRKLDNEPITMGIGLSAVHGEDDVEPVLKKGKTNGVTAPLLEVGTSRILGEENPKAPTTLRNLKGDPVMGIGLSAIIGESDVNRREPAAVRGEKNLKKMSDEAAREHAAEKAYLDRKLENTIVAKRFKKKIDRITGAPTLSGIRETISKIPKPEIELPLPVGMSEEEFQKLNGAPTLDSIKGTISKIPKGPEFAGSDTENVDDGFYNHPKPFVKNSEHKMVASGFIDNKDQPKDLPTDLDEARWEEARPKFGQEVEDVDDLEIINPKPLFTVDGFLAKHEQIKEGQRVTALEESVAKKIQLETEMKKAKLNYIWAYKNVYPKFANEPEDDISKFPPPKFTFFSKDKQNLVALHQAVLDAEEEWLHAQGAGFVNKNVKDSKVKFHSEPIGKPGDVYIEPKKLEKAEDRNRLAVAKEQKRNTDTDDYLRVQEVLDPEFLFLKEKPTLKNVKAKADLAKSVYAKAYREMFPEQFSKDKKVTNDFISLLQPPKIGMLSFNKDKKRLLKSLYEVVQQVLKLENAQIKSK